MLAGLLKTAGRDERLILRTRLLNTLALLQDMDGGGPPDEPPGGGPPAPTSLRGYGEPTSGWYNGAAKGRPTYAEALVAACCIISTSERAEVLAMCLAVEVQEAVWAREGDAWSPPVNDPVEWANGGVVTSVLQRALAAQGVDWGRVGQLVHELGLVLVRKLYVHAPSL